MRALTIWQPWASLIIAGAKPFEWRRWCAPSWAINQQIVIHAGSRRVKMDEVEDIIDRLDAGDSAGGLIPQLARPLLARVLSGEQQLMTSVALGSAWLGQPRRAVDLVAEGIVGNPYDSDRVDEAMWGWPLSDIVHWPDPTPAKGSQGFWHWRAAAPGEARTIVMPARRMGKTAAIGAARARDGHSLQLTEEDVPY